MAMLKAAVLVLVMFLTVGCARFDIKSLSPTFTDPKAPSLVLHMDTAFTPAERADADRASAVWKAQTSGVADIKLVYDLDFDDLIGMQKLIDAKANLVVRYESGMAAVAASDEEADCDGCVLGWMTAGGVHNIKGKPVYGAFVADRIEGPGIRLQVMLHEFGHALGLPHVASRQSLMYPHAIPGRTACLKPADLTAFCEVNVCNGAVMHPCE
jgi:hypothetical protein